MYQTKVGFEKSQKIRVLFKSKNSFANVHFLIRTFKKENKNFHDMGTLGVNINNMDKFNKKWDLCMGSVP